MGGMDVTEPTGTGRDAVVDDVEQVWRDLGPDALRLAAALVGPHDAHDITESAFVRVTTSADWDLLVDRRAYLLRAVRNQAHNLYRARRRRWRRDIAGVRPAALVDVHLDVDVYRALAKLSLRQRSVVFFAYWHDMTESEIAELLALSRSTIHRDLRMARERLRKELS
jgi:RNA polymerase sigma factor (sigma-70 family)